MVLVAMVPVAFAEPYISLQRGLVFTVITAACVLAMAALARFTQLPDAVVQETRWIETAFIVDRGAAQRPSRHGDRLEQRRGVEDVRGKARRTRRHQARRLREPGRSPRPTRNGAASTRDLHDGAQQHLVALSVLVQLARNAERDRAEPLLTEASELVDTAISEIRRLAHGIYPPLLISGGLAEALPALAARASVPVQLDLGWIGRYPPSTEAAFYYCCSEALQNAAKHGGPNTTVTVTAVADEQTLTLMITDTGCGFNPDDHGDWADEHDGPTFGHWRSARDLHVAWTWYSHHRRRRHSGGAGQLARVTGVCTPPPTVMLTRWPRSLPRSRIGPHLRKSLFDSHVQERRLVCRQSQVQRGNARRSGPGCCRDWPVAAAML